jgi:serine/threonine protein phosphatase PrpC
MTWRLAVASRIGGRSEQQDRAAVFSARNGAHLAVVADGMGGHQSGAAAAQAVIDIARERFAGSTDHEPRALLEAICLAAHDAISALPNGEGPSAGSTCILFYANGPEAYWMHVGDARLYHFGDDQLLHRTRDHSLVQVMLDQKKIGEAEALEHPMQNQIYMRLGGENRPEPAFDCLALEDSAVFMLCTDGFWGVIEPGAAMQTLKDTSSVEDAVNTLVDRASELGGPDGDNISLVVAEWLEPPGPLASRGGVAADESGVAGWKRIVRRAKAAFGA